MLSRKTSTTKEITPSAIPILQNILYLLSFAVLSPSKPTIIATGPNIKGVPAKNKSEIMPDTSEIIAKLRPSVAIKSLTIFVFSAKYNY